MTRKIYKITKDHCKAWKYLSEFTGEEIKCRFKAGHLCYYSDQTLLSSRLHYKNLKIKM